MGIELRRMDTFQSTGRPESQAPSVLGAPSAYSFNSTNSNLSHSHFNSSVSGPSSSRGVLTDDRGSSVSTRSARDKKKRRNNKKLESDKDKLKKLKRSKTSKSKTRRHHFEASEIDSASPREAGVPVDDLV